MPSHQVCNASTCWQQWAPSHIAGTFPFGKGYIYYNRQGLLNNIDEIFAKYPGAINPQSQFERDAGFWYGAMMHPGTSQPITLQKVFSILYYGGLMVRRGGGWATWQSLGNIPIAAAISHTARVLVQLPPLNPQDANSNIWAWLNQENSIHKRWVATHGIKYVTGEMVNGVPKKVKERKAKTGLFDDHYCMNVALGGQGRYNLFSGNQIEANGYHGHLYLCYTAPTAEKVGGLLIATEQSASADVMAPDASFFQKVKLARKGVDDQWGGTHSTGAHNTYSATGGNDWTKDNLAGLGPDQYIDGMYVDLSQRYQYTQVLNNWANFTADLLGWTGQEPPPPRPQQQAPLQGPPARPPQGVANVLRNARRGDGPPNLLPDGRGSAEF